MGAACDFVHRLPGENDIAQLNTFQDVFGRERQRGDKDDMGGSGSFLRDNRTLYVGGLKSVHTIKIEEILRENFSEWGPIEKLRVLLSKQCAFITYEHRVYAEFAKEAMIDQSLNGSGQQERLNIRWATSDPNPAAQRAETQQHFAQADGAVAAYYASLGPEAKAYYDWYASSGSQQQQQQSYPNTDAYYQTGSTAAHAYNSTPAQKAIAAALSAGTGLAPSSGPRDQQSSLPGPTLPQSAPGYDPAAYAAAYAQYAQQMALYYGTYPGATVPTTATAEGASSTAESTAAAYAYYYGDAFPRTAADELARLDRQEEKLVAEVETISGTAAGDGNQSHDEETSSDPSQVAGKENEEDGSSSTVASLVPY